MHKVMIGTVAILLGGPALGAQSAEQREIMRTNAAQATAAARHISRDTDPDGRAANCYVFIAMSRNAHSRAVGRSDAAMRRAQRLYYDFLVRRLTRDGAAQLAGSSGNPLAPAAPAARDAASRYCVANAERLASRPAG
jgi:hypothetical protein